MEQQTAGELCAIEAVTFPGRLAIEVKNGDLQLTGLECWQ